MAVKSKDMYVEVTKGDTATATEPRLLRIRGCQEVCG